MFLSFVSVCVSKFRFCLFLRFVSVCVSQFHFCLCLCFGHLYIVDYLEVQDTILNSLMMRHSTLSATKQDLMDNLISMTDEVPHNMYT